MKSRRTLVGVACLACGIANAQDAVTLYGVVDGGLTYISNAGGGHWFGPTSGNEAGDRWGLRGSESLGGGTRAIFTIEAGFDINTGATAQGGTAFGRQVFVGLAGNAGQLTIGRHRPLTVELLSPFESGASWAAPGTGYGAHVGDADNIEGSLKINNSVKYVGHFGPVVVNALYGFGNVAGHASGNQILSAGAVYAGGPLKWGLAYQRADRPNFSIYGGNLNASATGSNMKSVAYSGFASAATQQVLATGGSYEWGRVTFTTIFSRVRFTGLGQVAVANLSAAARAYTGSANLDTGEVGLQFHPSPALMLGAAYAQTRDRQDAGPVAATYRQVNFGAVYSMSKLTSLYAIAIHQNAGGIDSTSGQAVAAINATTASTQKSQSLITIGIKKTF